jgi:hypothetical protein
MNINELTGYKNSGYYPVAQHIFRNPDSRGSIDAEYNREFQFAKWTSFLESRGFVHLGSGAFGGTYEKAGYPWIFKVFKNDDAYRYYIKYAMAHQANINLPRVKGRVIKINDETYAVRLEKLSPIDKVLYLDLYAAVRAMVTSEGMIPHRETAEFIDSFRKEYPGIYEIIGDMLKLPYRLDFTQDNIMIRGNTPVVIDPIADI